VDVDVDVEGEGHSRDTFVSGKTLLLLVDKEAVRPLNSPRFNALKTLLLLDRHTNEVNDSLDAVK
jgi:hypothetical protein